MAETRVVTSISRGHAQTGSLNLGDLCSVCVRRLDEISDRLDFTDDTVMIGCRKSDVQGVCIYRRDVSMILRFRTRYDADVIVISTEVEDVVGVPTVSTFAPSSVFGPHTATPS
jgi:hypothetical protein